MQRDASPSMGNCCGINGEYLNANEQLLLAAEDLDRSIDRTRVLDARRNRRSAIVIWLLLGPGVLAMLGENDGPSMLSYAFTGATYGIGFFLPFILVTFAAAYVIQEISMRLGAVTHRGYGELIFQRYGRFWGWVSAGDLLVTNLITLITEVIAIRIGMAFFGISGPIAVAFAVGLVALGACGSRYARWEQLTFGLSLFNLAFLAVTFFGHPSLRAIGYTLMTWTPFPRGTASELLLILASNIGATVTPWMLFFQQSASADKGMTPQDIAGGRIDTGVGAMLAAIAGCGGLVAAAPLFIHRVDMSAYLNGMDFPQALLPIIGRFGASLFALGLIEAGAVAMLTISASTAYAVSEVTGGAGHSFNHSIREAPMFHLANVGVAAIAGLIVLIPRAPLLAITLNVNLLATVLMPAALVFLLLLANDHEIMGRHVNSKATNILAILITIFVTAAGCGCAIVSFVATFHGKGR